MSGKGSRPRPYSVDQKTFDANWDAIFKKNKEEDKNKDTSEKDQNLDDTEVADSK